MRIVRIGLAIAIAVALQTAFTSFFVGTNVSVDFLLVVVVFVAVRGGPVVGLWTGTVSGLIQDLLSGGIIGVSGLVKSMVGFGVGFVGAQLFVTDSWKYALILVGTTVVHAICLVGVYAVVPRIGPAVLWVDLLVQCVLNATVGFFMAETLKYWPRVQESFKRRRDFGRRRWRTS